MILMGSASFKHLLEIYGGFPPGNKKLLPKFQKHPPSAPPIPVHLFPGRGIDTVVVHANGGCAWLLWRPIPCHMDFACVPMDTV